MEDGVEIKQNPGHPGVVEGERRPAESVLITLEELKHNFSVEEEELEIAITTLRLRKNG